MENSKVKGYIGAFIAGGILGVLGQLIFALYSGMGIPYPVQAMVFTLGFLGALSSYLGIFQKLAPHGGMGVDMTMYGLAGGIAMLIINARNEGKANGEAVKFGMGAPSVIFPVGGAVSLVLAIAIYFIGGGAG